MKMGENEKVRLVRCPKCENLLPELADFSVYQCGGCGAVLRAKDKSQEVENLSEKSDEERIEGFPQKPEKLSEKGIVNVNGASETDMKPSIDALRGHQNSSNEDEVVKVGNYTNFPKNIADKQVIGGDPDVAVSRNGSGDLDRRMKSKEVKPLFDSASTSRRPGWVSEWQSRGRGEMDSFLRNPANYVVPSGLSYGEPEKRSDPDAYNPLQYIDQDRAELLKKINELKDQLSRSLDVANQPREKVPLGSTSAQQELYGTPNDGFPGSSSAAGRASMQFPMPSKVTDGPPYFRHFPEPFPYSHRPEMAMHNFYPPGHNQNYHHAYGDLYGSHFVPRTPYQAPGQYQYPPLVRPYEPYPYSSALHHPSCSCFHCYSAHKLTPSAIPSAGFHKKRFPEVAHDPILYHPEKPAAFSSYSYNPRTGNPRLKPEVGILDRTCPQKVVASKSGVYGHPVAGGAPFVTCCSCFELLRLPRNVLNMENCSQRLRCGACSAVITCEIIDKKLVLSMNGEELQAPMEVNYSSSEMVNGTSSHVRGHENPDSGNYSLDYYDSSGYEFKSLDKEPILMSMGQGSNSSKTTQSFHSSSPSTSEDENSPDVLIPSREQNDSSQQPINGTLSPPPAGSPLQEYLDYSSYNCKMNRFGKGNQSGHVDYEKVAPNKAATRQNTVTEESQATEMDVSYNEFSNTGVSFDLRDANREDDPPRVNKGNESFFANVIKKSFSSSRQAAENGKATVSINGNPIPDRLVKKAEKLAGTIRPGQYWYDYHAGFWGVMGGPCLGIIPPSIEEFSYPMPEDCAGGNTGVFVNGRELHLKDLDLLANRGLPTERDRSYIVEISGRIWDEESGEELDCLGKLAPTVEREKHGFGMKVKFEAS